MKPQRHPEQKRCLIGTTGKGLPCMVSIHTLAGLTEPCEVCAPYIPKMREFMGWTPFRGRFFMSNRIAGFQADSILDKIKTATELDAHVKSCSQCAGPDDGCEEGQRLEERLHQP